MSWWYLSYAKPEGFIGAVILRGNDIGDAASRAAKLGIRAPGAEILGARLPLSELPAERYRNCFLTQQQVREFWPDAMTIREAKAQGGYDLDALAQNTEVICPACAAGKCGGGHEKPS